MHYFKTSQPIPDKGDAWMYYECSDEDKIMRYVTWVPATGESERNDNPVIKKLFRPELLQASSQEEFEKHWNENS